MGGIPQLPGGSRRIVVQQPAVTAPSSTPSSAPTTQVRGAPADSFDAAPVAGTRPAASAQRSEFVERLQANLPTQPLPPGRARAVGPERADLAGVLQPRLDAARAALQRQPPDVAAAAQQFSGLPTPYNDQANISDARRWSDALSAMGLNQQQRTAVEQLRVMANMSTAISRPVQSPPSADDLTAYGQAFRARPLTEANAAFSEYSAAFNVHVDRTIARGSPARDVAYPEHAAPSAAFPPNVATHTDGRSIQDCDGFALQAQAFYGGAGCQTRFATAVQSGVPLEEAAAHRMLFATRGRGAGAEHALVSSQDVTAETAADRATALRALEHVPSMRGLDAHVTLSAEFSNHVR